MGYCFFKYLASRKCSIHVHSYMLWMSKHSWKLPVVQNYPSGLQYSSKRKTLHESLLRFFPFHFVVDPFLGKISVPCMPGASATKQAPRCFGDVSPWRWNERSNPRGHEEVIDQQREELEAILMLLNWIWLSMNGDWTLSLLFFVLFYGFASILLTCLAKATSSVENLPLLFRFVFRYEGIVTL